MSSKHLICFLLSILFTVNSSYATNQIQRSIVNKRANHTNLYSLRDHYKNCDTVIKNKKFGFISSPFFPNQFPLPIYCRWVIDLSSFTSRNDNQTLVVYLNEVYVKRGVKFTEYSYFLDETLNIDKNELPVVGFNSNSSYVSTRRKYLVVQFQVDEKINHNLNARILDSPAAYNGFNLTFELTNRTLADDLDRSTSGDQEFCSFRKCNFNGRCITRLINGSVRFKCDCFDHYHGELGFFDRDILIS